MNSKRQTIWLVSMLSLMVILSAYYLFTEDTAGKSDLLTESAAVKDATEAAGSAQDAGGIVVDEVTSGDSGKEGAAAEQPGAAGTTDGGSAAKTGQSGDEGAAGSGSAAGQSQTPDKASGDAPSADKGTAGEAEGDAKSDQEVLEQWEAQGQAANYFDDIQQRSDQRYSEQYDKLMSQISDVDKDPEQATKSLDELNQFEGRHEKLTGIQDELRKKYKNVAIDAQGDHYKIVVQSDKLDKGQAADILDLVMKQLGVGAGSVSIQYMP